MVLEGNILKLYTSVGNFIHRVFRVGKQCLFIQHLRNPPCACKRHGNHDENHGYHHKIHQDIHAVGHKAHKLPRGKAPSHNHFCAHPANQQNAAIHCKVHDRAVPRHDIFRLTEKIVEISACLFKFLIFIILPDIGLHHPDGRDIFLHAFV